MTFRADIDIIYSNYILYGTPERPLQRPEDATLGAPSPPQTRLRSLLDAGRETGLEGHRETPVPGRHGGEARLRQIDQHGARIFLYITFIVS